MSEGNVTEEPDYGGKMTHPGGSDVPFPILECFNGNYKYAPHVGAWPLELQASFLYMIADRLWLFWSDLTTIRRSQKGNASHRECFINEEESCLRDFQMSIEHISNDTHGDAHLKRTLTGHQAMLPVTKGKLDLGPWEQIFYAEFDGKRKKRVVVKILGE